MHFFCKLEVSFLYGNLVSSNLELLVLADLKPFVTLMPPTMVNEKSDPN